MTNGVVITEEPIIKTRDYVELKKELRDTTVRLFQLSEQIAAMNRPGGKHVLSTPSPYRCATCGNGRCLSHTDPKVAHPENRAALSTVRNSTAMWGCLGWLPTAKGAAHA